MKKKLQSICFIPLTDMQMDRVDEGRSIYAQVSRRMRTLNFTVTRIEPIKRLVAVRAS